MKSKQCFRCEINFIPKSGNTLYCVFCRHKHYVEAAAKRKTKARHKKNPLSPYDYRGWEGRLKKAMEVRAEYISEYYLRNGVLLNW
jgi:uncharacterized Zn finger protein (UPF0148 family)